MPFHAPFTTTLPILRLLAPEINTRGDCDASTMVDSNRGMFRTIAGWSGRNSETLAGSAAGNDSNRRCRMSAIYCASTYAAWIDATDWFTCANAGAPSRLLTDFSI